MYWTKNKPAVPGLYWIKFSDQNGAKNMLISQVLQGESELKFMIPPDAINLHWSSEAIQVPEESNIIQFPVKKETDEN